MDTTGVTEEDVNARISKARGAFVMLNKIWRDRTISLNTKLRIFNSNVKSTLYYGCETLKNSKLYQETPEFCQWMSAEDSDDQARS